MSRPTPTTGWDRAAIAALGAAGCALSYDALQQMAVAVHVRGPLTYLFPLVIDGFIAYGVRALLVLRDAPFTARLYIWVLFGTATAASIWANALHAIRLNQQHSGGNGLRLGDVTVGCLSTLAPLALAGAVHLYILIARRAGQYPEPGQQDTPTVRADRLHADRDERTVSGQPPTPVSALGRSAVTGRQGTTTPTGRDASATEKSSLPEPAPEHGGRTADLVGSLVDRPTPENRSRRHTTPRPSGHPTRAVSDDLLLGHARRAVTETGKTTRQVVAGAIRGQGYPLSNGRLTELMEQLRTEEPGQPDTPLD